MSMVRVELIGGPRDGELLEVPGDEPPQHLRVLVPNVPGPLVVWHPAVRGLPDMVDVLMVVLDLDHRPNSRVEWVYLWPHESHAHTD
jgi:hypothetical protein